MIKDLEKFLVDRLQKPLPGSQAHDLMRARAVDQPVNIKYSAPARKGAVMISIFPSGDGKLYFPLTQRPNYKGVHGGQISLPGGKVENNDKDLVETAKRETQEEIGVQIPANRIIGNLSELNVTASNFLVTPVISILEEKPIFTRDPREVDHIFEADLNSLILPETLKEKELTVAHNFRLHAPYFDIKNRVVWGATAMILSEFAQILKEFFDGETSNY